MKSIRVLAGAVLLFGFFAPTARADEAAQKFLEGIYQRYVGPNTPGIALDTLEALNSYFTPELANLIADDRERAEKRDEVPALDGDPFVDAQDWDIKDVSVRVKDTGPDTAVGFVSYTNFGEAKLVELDLKKIDAGWRVDDIRWPEGSLRDIFKDTGGGPDDPGAKSLPPTQKL